MGDHGIEHRVHSLDPSDRRLDELSGLHVSRTHEFGLRGGIEELDFIHGWQLAGQA